MKWDQRLYLKLGDCNMQVSAACYIHTAGQGTFSKIFRIHF